MSEQTVNIPLLRKAIEWAEAEAAKPPELREWEQNWYVLTASERERLAHLFSDPQETPEHFEATHKAPECGTCYCIAGYVTVINGGDADDDPAEEGARLLGLRPWQADNLFCGSNSIEDVRRIAEDIAGERL